MSRLSPLLLPWSAVRLAGRFVVPLALWYTVGQVARYLLYLVAYKFGLHNSVIPIIVLSLVVLTTIMVTIAMLQSVKDGLPEIRERNLDESLAPWVADTEETLLRSVGRSVFPFVIFYLAWGWFSDDARHMEQFAAGRGFGQGGFGQQLAGMKMLIALQDHLYIAIGATVVFFILKDLSERFVLPKAPSFAGILVAFCEVNWTLFGIFTIDQLRGKFWGWVTSRQLWGWIDHGVGPGLAQWSNLKNGVIGCLIWLVIAGLLLGIDAEDEEKIIGHGRVMTRVAKASGIHAPHTPREVMTRELREKWVPAVYGMRLVFRAGIVPFAVFCVMYTSLDPLADLATRGVYRLIGPHPVEWWNIRLDIIDFGVGLVHEMLRICLLAVAFNLVVARVSARSGTSDSDSGETTRIDVAPVRPH